MSADAKSRLSGVALPLAALAALVAYNMLFTRNFALIEVRDGRLFGAIIDVLHRGAPVAVLAIGMTLVIATKGIDLSVGAVMAIVGAAAALMITRTHLPVPAIVVLSLATGIAAGFWNGILVAYARVQPIVATLILMVAGRGIAQLMTGGHIVGFENKGFDVIGSGSLLLLPTTVFVAALVLLVAGFLARRTVVGSYIEAVGGNEIASAHSGISVGAVKVFVYAFCGLCAGIAGLMLTADIKAADASTVGLNRELDAILSVVIGGTLFTGGRFSLTGSVIGALIMQTLTTQILMNGLDPAYTLVVDAIIVVLVCALQSESLAGAARRLRARRGRQT